MGSKFAVTINLKLIGFKDKKIAMKIAKAFEEKLDSYPLPKGITPLYEILVDVDDGDLRVGPFQGSSNGRTFI